MRTYEMSGTGAPVEMDAHGELGELGDSEVRPPSELPGSVAGSEPLPLTPQTQGE